MGNHTVNTQRIGRPAGEKDSIAVVGMSVEQGEKGIEVSEKFYRNTIEREFLTIKAYNGGNPKNNGKEEEEILH